ncbi:MAG: type IX secretion system membrane protein PorP/SprF [Candidatus Pedobacter colombiensis]|uniref:Type IX secretion system membrane protein PorP/SprF n=1 Tax=Candidatus Pedobacter colombiensis TaxID=3121371 RepID=A0AAJ5WC29_9SPHI|nr:type IX secretion system membrane protein PorP/SprF [Pedobacter sp.]WEK20845.1 MAG: type IX secretion system membrane protein PorP/SprF [Pedobacter sp.]
MKKIILILFIFCSLSETKAQLDSQYSQYLFNGIHINPAYAGYKDDIYVQSFYRAQWEGIKGAPKSFSVSADGAFNDGNVGLGLILSNDQLGAQSYLTAYLNYAYRIRMGDNEASQLAFGIAGGIIQLGLDGNKLEGYMPGDGLIPVGSQTNTVPDARFGIYYANETYFAGLSATNVLAKYMVKKNTENMMVPVPQPHFYFTAGAIFSLNEDMRIKPLLLLRDDSKGPSSLDLNAFILLKESLWIGGFYRTSFDLYKKNYLQSGLTKQNAIGAILEVFATKNLRIGYSYDYSINKLRDYNSGSHEISAGFYINRKDAKRNRQLRCYDF